MFKRGFGANYSLSIELAIRTGFGVQINSPRGTTWGPMGKP